MLKKTPPKQLIAFLLATAIWLPSLHCFYESDAIVPPRKDGLTPLGKQMVDRQLVLWSNPALREHELEQMRKSNPEWDFMSRSYLVWSLANIGLEEPSKKDTCIKVMDQIIVDTLKSERTQGIYYFLMPYAKDSPFTQRPAGSQFLDGEIALMIGLRRVLQEKPEYKLLMEQRIQKIVTRMEASPTLSAESYPNECWTFCNVVALDAIKTADYLDSTDHSVLLKRWVALAKLKLTDPKTGLLVSSYTLDGQVTAGPQGSSIWMIVHCLQLIDRDFANDQYRRARRELGCSILGFGYSKEWPDSWQGPENVDSGVLVPGTDISPGATGMAFLGAASFDDTRYLKQLTASINFGGFSSKQKVGIRYCASNEVGDAVLLYAAVLGPMWAKISGRHS
jgi:hypothetical protein